MRVLQIGADRSKRGILVPDSPAFERQAAYARAFGALDIVGFSLAQDAFVPHTSDTLHTYPTQSSSRFFFGIDAIRIARTLPRPDIVSVQDPFETGVAGLIIAQLFRAPLHVQVHTDFLAPAYASHSTLNRVRVMLARLVLRRAARIRVVSDRIKRSIEQRYGTRAPITILPIYVDIGKYAQLPRDENLAQKYEQFATKLLYVGRLEREKHPCLAVDAFAAAPVSACLIIVGGGSERQELEHRAKRLGVADRVFFEGERSADPFFPLADLLLVTSRYEGYGLTIIEALAGGVPVLATDVGIAREAGAEIAPPEHFTEALNAWFEKGPRTGMLRDYPYASFDEYARAYADDIRACTKED